MVIYAHVPAMLRAILMHTLDTFSHTNKRVVCACTAANGVVGNGLQAYECIVMIHSYPWAGNIYVCDYELHEIQIFKSDGAYLNSFGSQGSEVCAYVLVTARAHPALNTL
jgi:hypothetical protein